MGAFLISFIRLLKIEITAAIITDLFYLQHNPYRLTLLKKEEDCMKLSDEHTFLLRNLLRGMFWLLIVLLLFLFIKKRINSELLVLLEPVLKNNLLVFVLYTLSEILFGIVPPEIFMIWALGQGTLYRYAVIVTLLAVFSYLAGISGFWFGKFLRNTRFFHHIVKKRLHRYEEKFELFGPYLILVAALTPLPFSAIAMMGGAAEFSFRKYLLFSSARFLRFAVYSGIIWEANLL